MLWDDMARMTRWLRFPKSFGTRVCPAIIGLLLLGPYAAKAQDTPPASNLEVIERYEQILEREPVEGPSLDKLLQIYQEGEGFEKLDERWAPLSAQPGAKGATYLLLRGLLADRSGKTDDARRFLQAATQAQPDDFHGWLALGDFEMRQGKWVDAITAFQKGLATPVSGDDRLSLYRKLGEAQQRNLDTAAALATWQKMVGEFPKDPFAVEEAGAAELDAEQFDEAKKTFQKLVDLTEPNSMNRVQALMHLAEVDDRQGKTDDAVHDYEGILPLTAESSWLNRELRAQIEQVYRREDDLAGLVDYYQKWSAANPKDVEALLLLSAALDELGKKPEALDVLRKVTVLAPDRHEVRETFAQRLVEAKQYDEAITVLTALTADDPTEPRYWETMGDALWLKTQPLTPESKTAVLDAWNHIAPPESKDVAAVLEVADLCREHNLNDEALAYYHRALALSPDATDIREKAVKLLIDLKREDEAWKLLDAMVEGSQATSANYLTLATLDQQFGRKDAEVDAIQKGLALEPANFDLLSMEWSRLAEAQKWPEAVALFDRLIAAAPNAFFVDQLEARQVQALTSAGLLDDTDKRLKEKLGAEPGLTEGELRLLLRIMIQQSDADIPKALDEAHRRFPQSVGLIRIEVDYNRHLGNFDAAVAALQKLVEAVPEQKADLLTEIVHVRQDQGNFDEALKAAQQMIDASPASADGYLLYAEMALAAGKTDDAVAKLQAAIKLSDKPNEVRQRLARYYLEAGQAAKARTIYDEAFADADNPQDKLTIVRAMSTAYFQDGQIEELINRFKKEQDSEEGGWRYGLYLAAIYEQTEDYGAARRELAKSLAVRPQDTGLLHSLIGLAEKEGDSDELLRYREMLAEADPSGTNELALANEYAIQNKPEDAWRIVQKNLTEVVKDPMAWKDVLNQIADPDYAAKIKGVFEEAIRAKGNALEGLFALAQFQMQQGDLEGAKGTLWEILAAPLPPAPKPMPPSASSNNAPSGFSIFGSLQGPLMLRASQSYLALNEAQQLLAPAQTRNQMRQINTIRMYQRAGISTTLDPVAIKDHALVYLSVIAMQQKQAEDFLKELQAKIEAWHWPLSERVVAYALIQARSPLLDAIEEQAKAAPEKELDQLCLGWCDQFMAEGNDETMRKRAEAAQTILSQRLEQDPATRSQITLMQVLRLSAAPNPTPEAVAKRKTTVDDYLKTMDRKNPDQLFIALEICSQTGDWDGIKQTVDDLAATDRSKWSITVTQALGYLPLGILQQATTTKEVMPKEVIPVMLDLMRLGYPATPPHPSLAGTGANQFFSLAYYNQTVFPPPNRYFPADRVGNLEPMFQQLKARDMLPAMYLALDQEEKDFNDWRKIYPILLRVYFQWWDGKKDDSIASVRKLLEQDSSDDFRLLLASMLSQQQKYNEAIPVLESVTARYGPDYIRTQKELLHVARLAKNNDVGQKAGLRLLGLRLPQQEQMQILDDLRNVGLKDKADELLARQNNRASGANNTTVFQANNQLMQNLLEALNQQDETRATDLARQILNRDPMSGLSNGMSENYLRIQALNVLKRFGQLDDYAQEVEKQLAATPDSVRLNWAAAEAYQNMESHLEKTMGLASWPQWLKLQRTGNKIEGFYSLNGTNWTSAGDATLDLPGKVYFGFWISSERRGPPVQVTVDQIAFTGKTSAADAIPQSSIPSPPATSETSAPATGTNAASSITPDATAVSANIGTSPGNPSGANTPSIIPPPSLLSTPWQQSDIGPVTQPGSVNCGSDGSLALAGALTGQPRVDGGTHYVYQMLEGDGSVVARFNHLTGPANEHLETVGIMIRESVDRGSRAATVALNPMRGIEWQSRNRPVFLSGSNPQMTTSMPDEPMESAGWSNRDTGEFTLPLWLKLARKGNTFTGGCSFDGKNWSDLFSHDVAMGPDSRIGLMSRATSAEPSESTWTDVKVAAAHTTGNPAQSSMPPAGETAPTTTALPPSWEHIDMGDVSTPGQTEWNGTELKLSSPGRTMGNDVRPYAFVYQTIHGDGEIVAKLTSETAVGNQSKAGLCFRSRLDPDSPEIEFFRDDTNQTGQVSYFISIDTAGQALKYFKKVAELEPKNQAVLTQIAEQLRQAKKPDAAADLYTSILKTDFNAGMNQSNNVLQAFEEANRLSDFIKIIEDWSPPPLNPMGGGGQDMYYVLVQVGNQLKQGHHLPEAEQVYRKALSVETFQTKQDGVVALAQVLIDENKRDDAAAEIEKWMLDQGSPAPTPPPILGFNVPVQNQINWYQSMGWNQNGIINSPMIHFLELADELGLTAKLRQELQAKVDKKASMPGPALQIDPDRVTCILLSIMAHDPGYRPEVEKLLKDYPATSLNMGGNTNVFLILAQQLAKWPQEQSMALRLVGQVYAGTGMAQNFFFKNVAGLQVLRIALAMGDHKTAKETLRSLADGIREQRAINPGQVQLEQALMMVHGMIREGMFKEAGDMLIDCKTDPQWVNGNTYYQQRMNQVQQELAFAQGMADPSSLVYGLRPTDGKSNAKGIEFFWELSADKGRNSGSYESTTAWSDDTPIHPTAYRLEVDVGPNEMNATTRIASLDHVATRGSTLIRIPKGMQVLQATLIRVKPDASLTTGSTPTPATTPTPVASGHYILLGAPENLLKNPDFKISSDTLGKPVIAGWHGLLRNDVNDEPGGPLPASGFRTLAGNYNGSQVEITSDRIPFQPGMNYALSGWTRGPVNMGVRCLDANGKVLDEHQFSPNSEGWTWISSTWGEHEVSQATGRRNGGTSIVPNTAFFEIFFRQGEDFNVTGLSFRIWPVPETNPPSADKPASTPAPHPPPPGTI